jgi:hypothetical protein
LVMVRNQQLATGTAPLSLGAKTDTCGAQVHYMHVLRK